MYEGEFTVFRAGFLAIQFKTKMHKIGTRIAFLLEEKKSTIFLPIWFMKIVTKQYTTTWQLAVVAGLPVNAIG